MTYDEVTKLFQEYGYSSEDISVLMGMADLRHVPAGNLEYMLTSLSKSTVTENIQIGHLNHIALERFCRERVRAYQDMLAKGDHDGIVVGTCTFGVWKL